MPQQSESCLFSTIAMLKGFQAAATSVCTSYLASRFGMNPMQCLISFGVWNVILCVTLPLIFPDQRKEVRMAVSIIRPRLSWLSVHTYASVMALDAGWFALVLAAALIGSANSWTLTMALRLCLMTPAVWAAFDERPSMVVILASLGCVIGSTLTIHPPFIFEGDSLPIHGVLLVVLNAAFAVSYYLSTQHVGSVCSPLTLSHARFMLGSLLYLGVSGLYFVIHPHQWTSLSDPRVFGLFVLCGFTYASETPLTPIVIAKIGSQMTVIFFQTIVVWSVLLEMVLLSKVERVSQYCGMIIVICSVIAKPTFNLWIQRSEQENANAESYHRFEDDGETSAEKHRTLAEMDIELTQV